MKLHFILLLSVVTSIVSCNNDKPVSSNIVLGRNTFIYDSINSKLVDHEFKYDSLFVNRSRDDSITITRYLGGNGYYNYITFSLKNDLFYENRKIPQLIIDGETEIYTVLVPTFSHKDTVYYYFPKDDFFTVFVNDLSFDKCKYQIKKNNDDFLTIKQSIVDTTYSEIYYYDQFYNIYKYINTWKDNKCVYVKR